MSARHSVPALRAPGGKPLSSTRSRQLRSARGSARASARAANLTPVVSARDSSRHGLSHSSVRNVIYKRYAAPDGQVPSQIMQKVSVQQTAKTAKQQIQALTVGHNTFRCCCWHQVEAFLTRRPRVTTSDLKTLNAQLMQLNIRRRNSVKYTPKGSARVRLVVYVM